MKATISSAFSRTLTSVGRRDALRWWYGLPRRWKQRAAIVHYFHQDDDPYSELLATVLPRLQERYHIDLRCHRVALPDDASAPDRGRLRDWSIRDAAALQAAYELAPDPQTNKFSCLVATPQRLAGVVRSSPSSTNGHSSAPWKMLPPGRRRAS